MRGAPVVLSVPCNVPRTVMLCGTWHSCSASLATLLSDGNGSLPGVAAGLATLLATVVHGPAQLLPPGGLVSISHTLPGPIQRKRAPVWAGSTVPFTVKDELEVTMTSLAALAVSATVTLVVASFQPLGSVPSVVWPPAPSVP